MSSNLDVLRSLRKRQDARESRLVHSIGQSVLPSLSDDEKWSAYEQLVIASLDVGDVPMADKYIALLRREFPESERVRRLQGMRAEASRRYEDAATIYTDKLEKNSADLIALRRQAASLKAQGKTLEAVEAMHKVLEVSPCDTTTVRPSPLVSNRSMRRLQFAQKGVVRRSACLFFGVLLQFSFHLCVGYFPR